MRAKDLSVTEDGMVTRRASKGRGLVSKGFRSYVKEVKGDLGSMSNLFGSLVEPGCRTPVGGLKEKLLLM